MRTHLNARLGLWIALVALTYAPQGWTSTNFWFAPAGTGDGSAPDHPRRYNAKFMQWAVLNGGPGQDRDVSIHFLPGEYLVEPLNTTTTTPSDWRIRIVGLGKHPQDTVLKLQPNYPKGASHVGGDWVDVIDLGRNSEYLQRFEMENITIDGNWTGQTNYNHAGYLRGYKNSPVYVNARTGRIRKVIVRNYGAHGIAPQRTTDMGAGIEVFPIHIVTEDEGQQPEGGDPRPWVVEDCEVSGFHGPYNGYTTALFGVARLNVPKTPRWSWDDRTSRLLWFRRNQVRGVPGDGGVIALGGASHGTNITGKITWSDNVVLNSTVFNTDTGTLRQLDFTNSIGLDIFVVGYVGTHSTREPYMTEYTISGNSFRFGWALTLSDYRNFSVGNRPDGRLATRYDRALRVGRPMFPPVTGLTLQGIARDIRYTDNWFTSRSREDFVSLDPIHPREPRYRIVHRMPSRDPEQTNGPMITRKEALDMDFSNNRISAVPFDFEGLKPLNGGRIALLGDGSSPMLELREAPAAPTSGFVPSGLLERVEMVFTNVTRRIPWKGVPFGAPPDSPREGAFDGPDRVLIGAIEVIAGRPTPATAEGGTFRLPVRVALQPTPYARLKGTQPLSGRRVFLEVLSGSLHPQRLSAESDPQGIATFSYPVKAGANGVDYFRVWTEGAEGRDGEWDEYQDAWSTAHFAHGQTVGVRVVTAVSDSENGSPGEFRLIRSGDISRPLTVNLALENGPALAESGRDYQMKGPARTRYPGGKEGETGNVGDSIEFPRGEREITLKVEPLAAKARSGRLVDLRILAGDGYAPGEPPVGQVVIYVPAR